MNLFEKIIYGLQFEIERPNSYGLFHLIWILLSVILIIYFIKGKETNHEKSLKRILLIYGIGAFVLELLKQIIWSFNYDSTLGVVTWNYQWYAFPYQLCTTPIFVSIICSFLKKNKIRDSLLSYMAFVTILGSVATAIYPESCFVRTLLVDIHTMYLHFGSLVVSLYLLISKEVKVNFKSFINGYIVFIMFVISAEIINVVIYNLGILGDETFNMFYISPYFISSLPIFDIIQKNTPFIIYLLIYLLSIFIGSYLVYIISKIIRKRKDNKYDRN